VLDFKCTHDVKVKLEQKRNLKHAEERNNLLQGSSRVWHFQLNCEENKKEKDRFERIIDLFGDSQGNRNRSIFLERH